MQKLYIIKIGGNIIDDEKKVSAFIKNFASVKNKYSESSFIIVHGGGKTTTKLAAQLGINQQMIDGRRVTDAETLKVVTMVYAGLINKNIVAQLQACDIDAVGLCGADGNIIKAHKRINSQIDYGFAGDVDAVNSVFINSLLNQNLTIVISPITHDKKGQLLNTNADTIANKIAIAMSKLFRVELMYCFEMNGVLYNKEDENSVIKTISNTSYQKLKEDKIISDGMIPKLDNAFEAIHAGVTAVIIGNAVELDLLIQKSKGTRIIHE